MTIESEGREQSALAETSRGSSRSPTVVFESYGRADAQPLATRLRSDLERSGYDVWQDVERIRGGHPWEHQVQAALHDAHVVVALLSPQAVRSSGDPQPGSTDSVCLDELSYARFAARKPIVPVMALPCEPPFVIYRLDYVDLCDWEASEEAYQAGLARIVEAIAAATRGEVRYRRWDREFAPWDFTPYLNEKRSGFVGREWLYADLEAWRASADESALLLVGDPGAGKTALVAELVLRNPEGRVLAYHCCQSDTPATLEPGRFVRSMAAMLATQLPAYAAAIEQPQAASALEPAASDADPRTAFEAGIVGPLWTIPEPTGGTRYLLIDALDECLAPPRGSLTIVDVIASRLGRLPPWIRLVATTRATPAILDRFESVEVKAIAASDERNLHDVRAYIDGRLGESRLQQVVVAAGDSPERVAARVATASEGNFLYARQAIDALSRQVLSPGAAAKLPPGVGSLYHSTLAAQFPAGDSFEPARGVLETLLASPEALTLMQLSAISGQSQATVTLAVTALSGYVSVAGDTYSLFHRSFAEWIESPASGDFRAAVESGRRRILAYCRRWLDTDDPFAFSHLPEVLAAEGLVDELETLLEQTSFLARKRDITQNPNLEANDFAVLASAYLREGKATDIVRLANHVDTSRRDGVVIALATTGNEDTVRQASCGLLGSGKRKREPVPLPSSLMNARTAGLRVAALRNDHPLLLEAALDPSPGIRAMATPLLLRVFDSDPDRGWELFTQLRVVCKGRLGTVRGVPLEAFTSLSVALLAQRYESPETLPRLRNEWRLLARGALRGPLARTLAGKVGGLGLARVIESMLARQPAWQQFNLLELRACARIPMPDRRAVTAALEDLREPGKGFGRVLALVEHPSRAFDLYTMLVVERTLVYHGTRNAEGVLEAVSRAYETGPSWFQQSVPYVCYQVLRANPKLRVRWQPRYERMTLDWIERTRAVLSTPNGSYVALPNIAAAEDLAQRECPGTAPRIIPDLLATALANHDRELTIRLIQAASQLSLGYHHHLAALEALRPSFSDDSPDIRSALISALADVRLLAEGLTDRFVAEHGSVELAELVRNAMPSIRAADFGGWVDDFVNACVGRSDKFRLALCDAFTIAGSARSVSSGIVGLARWAAVSLASD